MQNKPDYLTLPLFSLLTEGEILKIKETKEIRNCKCEDLTLLEVHLLREIFKVHTFSGVITKLILRSLNFA